MRDVLALPLFEIDESPQDPRVIPQILLIGSLLDKYYIANSDESYRKEILGEDYCHVTLTPEEVTEIVSHLKNALIAPTGANTTMILWALGKVPTVEVLNFMIQYLRDFRGDLSEESVFQLLIGVENVISDSNELSEEMRHDVVNALIKVDEQDSLRVREIVARLISI